VEYTDPETGSVFFYNEETDESCWEKPNEVIDAEALAVAAEPTPSRARRRRSIVTNETVIPASGNASGKHFAEYTDPETGRYETRGRTINGVTSTYRICAYYVCTTSFMTHLKDPNCSSFLMLEYVYVRFPCPPTPLPTSVFFFNSETGESRWDKPDEVMEAEAQRMAEEPTPSVARRRRSIGVVSHLDQESGAVWMKYTDPNTNAVVSNRYS
jgi:hypothetical protein